MLKLLLADWLHADVAAIPIRETVFIKEQNVPEADEWGHGDETALHVVASLDGNAIGTARLTPEGTIGRMAVLKDFRNEGVGSAMLEKLIETAKQSKFNILTLNAQRSAESFYAKYGFTAYGDEFIDARIPHIAMKLKLQHS